MPSKNAPRIVLQKGLEGIGKGKTAMVTGVYGQDGSYMVDYLLALGYDHVFGAARVVSERNEKNIAHNLKNERFTFVELDITESDAVDRVVKRYLPNEIYHFAALSKVGPSFSQPMVYMRTNAGGVLNFIKAIEEFSPKTKMYFAGTTEMFGRSKAPQGYDTPFSPDSPYAIAKLEGYWHCIQAIEHGLFVVPGILSNHCSPRRGDYFVTAKITRGLKRVVKDYSSDAVLKMGSLVSKRDFGWAPDMVQLCHAALQMDEPKPIIGGTGISMTVEQFLVSACRWWGLEVPNEVDGNPAVKWTLRDRSGKLIAMSSPEFIRPMKPNELRISEQALDETYDRTGWRPRVIGGMVVKQMVEAAASEGPETVRFCAMRT